MIAYWILFITFLIIITTTIFFIKIKKLHAIIIIVIFSVLIFNMFPGYKNKGKFLAFEWEQETPPNLFSLLDNNVKTEVKIRNTSSKKQEGFFTMISDKPLNDLKFSKPTMLISGGEGSNVAIYKVMADPGEVITAQAVTADTVTIASGPTVKISMSSWNMDFNNPKN